MNNVALTGRLTADPEIRYTADSQRAVASFRIAVNRRGRDAGADFIPCKAFDQTAENIGKYFRRGAMIGITGSISTGSYTNRDGKTVYTTDILVDRFDFLERREESASPARQAAPRQAAPRQTTVDDFVSIPDDVGDEGLPFN